MDPLLYHCYLIPILPALAFAVILAAGRRAPGRGAYVAIGAIGLSWLWSTYVWWAILHGAKVPQPQWIWAISDISFEFGIAPDAGGSSMLVMVSFVSMLIFIYSIGYMREDPRYSRFFAYLSLFAASMLGLVIADNVVMLYMCWELVGLMSYLLIGFWFEKPEAARAAKKAFLVTRVGDAFFAAGILILFASAQSLSLDVIFDKVWSGQIATQVLFWVGICLFLGAAGKSAQFPLHVWLPDAMEGPTPVSALIHAATMVAAGVFMVWRMSPIFQATAGIPFPWDATFWVAGIGGLTAVMAASMALVQNDIKRILAYSTISQLGYMMLGLGSGAWFAGLFHLFTHAFFKALLFMGAGSVIVGTHHHQDIREFGGLARKMPITFVTFLMGTLALVGLGIPYFKGFSGFHSKDMILAGAYVSYHPRVFFALGLIGTLLTAFYMARCVFLTFLTSPRDRHVYEHARETPPVMTLPMAILALLSLGAGWWSGPFERFLEERSVFVPGASEGIFGGVRAMLPPEAVHASLAVEHQVELWALACLVVGALAGAWLYWKGHQRADALTRVQPLAGLKTLLEQRYYMDHLYGGVARGMIQLMIWCARFDLAVIDGIVNAVGYAAVRTARAAIAVDVWVVDKLIHVPAYAIGGLGGIVRNFETGYVQFYIVVTVIGGLGGALAAVTGRISAYVDLAVLCLAGTILTSWLRTWQEQKERALRRGGRLAVTGGSADAEVTSQK